MNKKEITQEIKKAYMVPDIRGKIDFANIQIESKPTVVEKRKSVGFTHFRIQFAAVIVIVLLLGVSFFLFKPGNSPIFERVTLTASEQDSFGVVSTSLLSDTTLFEDSVALQSVIYAESNNLFTSHIDIFNKYVNMVELFVGNQNQFITKVQSNELLIEGYEHYVTLHFRDIQNNEVIYDYYYNGDEFSSQGLIIIDGKTHYVEIEKEVDGEETEATYIVYQNPNSKDSNYIKMETEKDLKGEQVFKYMTFLNGNEVSVSEIKLESEVKTKNIEVKVGFEDKITGFKFKLKIERYLLNGSNTLRGEYEIETDNQGEEGYVNIRVFLNPETNRYEYDYELSNRQHSSGSRHHNRGRPFNDDDDEDDENDDDDYIDYKGWILNEQDLHELWEEDFYEHYSSFDTFQQDYQNWRGLYRSRYEDYEDFFEDYEDWLEEYQDEYQDFDEWVNNRRNQGRWN